MLKIKKLKGHFQIARQLNDLLYIYSKYVTKCINIIE
jgi:hypothetical protein